MSEVRALLAEVRAQLAEVPQQMLGRWHTPRRILGITRPERIVPAGSAWHVGSLLLGADTVAVVGDIIRAEDPGRRGYTAESARQRAAVRAAAVLGGIAPGTTVHIGWEPLDLQALERTGESGPLRLVQGEPMIRWSSAGMFVPLGAYLTERTLLLRDPPGGAG